MGVYRYIATDTAALPLSGTLLADSPREARDRLREQGLSVHELIEDAVKGSSFEAFQRWGAWLPHRTVDLSGFLRELATLLEVGSPMLEALDTATRARQGSIKRSLLRVREQVAVGVSLADAMQDASRGGRPLFDEVTVAMVRVGEDAGCVGEVLNQVATYQERGKRLKNRLASAMVYPMVVLVTGVAVSVFLMTYVVPGLLESLAEAGSDLPWITRVVKGMSDLLLGGWHVLLIGLMALMAAVILTLRSKSGRRQWHRLILHLPLIGEIARKQAVVRLSFVLSTLMRSGVGFENAIGIAQKSAKNVVLREALVDCEKAVQEGRDLAPALEHTKAFPDTVVQVFALGQASGRLEEMLDRLAEAYDRQVNTLAERLTALIEPVLILLLAAVVGAIAFATILPILEIGNAL